MGSDVRGFKVPARRWILSTVVFSAIATILAAHQTSVPPVQTFRAGTDLVLLDVSVLDKDRHPVRGLSASDFTVLVDGKPRPVVAFKTVELPPPAPLAPAAAAGATWLHEVASDVATNDHPPGRVVAILIDDYTIAEARLDASQIQKARETAFAIVDALGPDDRAAVLFTSNRHSAQTFTTDRHLLREAIEHAEIISDPPPVPGMDPGQNGYCECGVCAIDALANVSHALATLSDQRKTIFYVSAGSLLLVPRDSYASPTSPVMRCRRLRLEAADAAQRAAQVANVTIDAFDPKGLELGSSDYGASKGGGRGRLDSFEALDDEPLHRIEFLRSMADATGGRAIVNHNDPDLQVPAVMLESAAYYLLGVSPPARTPDGQFHPIEVRVNRRDVDVRTRKGYYDLTANEREAKATAGDTAVIADSLQQTTFPLSLSMAPFAGADRRPALALVLAIHPEPGSSTPPLPRADVVDLVASLFNPETGDSAGSQREHLTVTWNRPDPRFDYYEAFMQLPAKPGRYELRVGVKIDNGKTASVYTSVDVPDFTADLALSGLVLGGAPAPPNAAADAVTDLTPAHARPTTRRTFRKTDTVIASMRLYQKSADFAPATVTTQLTDAKGEELARDVQTLDGESDGERSAADYQMSVPVSALGAGDYLMTVSVAAAGKTAERRLRFKVE
jgi:VWFA-related protein